MLSLLHIEWMKLRRYRSFWILLLAFGLLLGLFYGGISSGMIRLGDGRVNLLGKAYNFSALWSDLGFYASYFLVIPAILVIILVTNEFQFRTGRQHIIDGWTRRQLYHAKWQLVLALSLVLTVFSFLLGVVIGIASGIPATTVLQGAEKLLWLFLSCVNYLGFALLLSLLFKRSGLAIGIFMAYSMILEHILHWILLFRYRLPAGDCFLPLQSVDELLPSSAARLLNASVQASRPEDWHYALAGCCWIGIYYLAGRRRLLKGDL